ncbi:MAG: helix-turn-helix transcriptional regulator [Tissierellia bacterium]|nr:helix-turn-helix transcriptional regulator [Tissierellia bacterium]
MKIEIPLTETVYLVLLSMIKANHGYGVQQFVERETDGRVKFGPGTLYGAINNLAKKKWIEPLPKDKNDRKKEYIITELGLMNLKAEISRMNQVLKIANRQLEENNEKV